MWPCCTDSTRAHLAAAAISQAVTVLPQSSFSTPSRRRWPRPPAPMSGASPLGRRGDGAVARSIPTTSDREVLGSPVRFARGWFTGKLRSPQETPNAHFARTYNGNSRAQGSRLRTSGLRAVDALIRENPVARSPYMGLTLPT